MKGPSSESKQIGEEKKQHAQRHILRKEFWTQLLEKVRDKTKMYANVSPGIYHWLGTGAGKSGIGYSFIITNKYAGCEIYLDRGKEYEEPNINKIRFDKLIKHKEEIEKDLGFKLNWERLDERRASKISYSFEGVGIREKDKWDELQESMIDKMISLEAVFRKYIKELE